MKEDSGLVRVGGFHSKTSETCVACRTQLLPDNFGHRFKTHGGGFDLCFGCAQAVYETVMADIAGAIFGLRHDVDRLMRERSAGRDHEE